VDQAPVVSVTPAAHRQTTSRSDPEQVAGRPRRAARTVMRTITSR
jgi:hypothetical protein